MTKQAQIERFKKAARELGADSEKRFNERLGKIVRQKPADRPKPKKKRMA